VELGRQITLPINLPGLQSQAMKLSFGAVRVDTIAIDDWTGTRSVVIAIAILELRAVAEIPIFLSGFRMEAFHSLLIRKPMEIDEPFSCDCGGAVSRTLSHLPEKRRPALRPLLQQACLGRSAVVCRPKEGGPILRHGARRKGHGLGMHSDVGMACGCGRFRRWQLLHGRRSRIAKQLGR
jgi:hypothetical protein